MCKYCKRLYQLKKDEEEQHQRNVDRLKRYIYRCDLVFERAIDELQDISSTLAVFDMDEETNDCVCRIDNLIDQLYALWKRDVI